MRLPTMQLRVLAAVNVRPRSLAELQACWPRVSRALKTMERRGLVHVESKYAGVHLSPVAFVTEAGVRALGDSAVRPDGDPRALPFTVGSIDGRPVED